MIARLLPLVLLLVCGGVHGQDSLQSDTQAETQPETGGLPTPEKDPEVMQVELLVFKHGFAADRAMVLHELQGSETPAPPEARPMYSSTESFVGAEEIREVVDYKSILLHREAQRIRASKDLEFVHHAIWTQPIYDANDAVYVRLLNEQSGGLLDGVARLIAGQYNRIDVHLYYDLDTAGPNPDLPCTELSFDEECKAMQAEQEPAKKTGQRPGKKSEPLVPLSRVLYINLNGVTPEGSLLYLDHPILGVLAQVKKTVRSPPPEPPDVMEAPAASTSLGP